MPVEKVASDVRRWMDPLVALKFHENGMHTCLDHGKILTFARRQP